ncbi:MAG: aconitate hydratase AcnA [Gammaproteobacteria bacterium]|nr:aconitate hydratase AcnA [Gammaproteobacteria bacterium]
MSDSFKTRATLKVGAKEYSYFNLKALEDSHQVSRLPFTHKVLLENLLRHEDGVNITKSDIEALANWDAKAKPATEIAFTPARVIMQDFTGVPAVVDLAAMRDAVKNLGGDASKINPLSPAELVIDHSVQVDSYGSADSLKKNNDIEFERNRERYEFLRWGQTAFDNFKVVPPNTGIVHQVNIEHLARVVFDNNGVAYPDTLVGTDSHTTMVNGLGVLGWGVGGIEAEAAMLGQPVSMLIPQVIGFKLTGQLPEGATATDLVLTVTEMLRDKGVVGKFVEFFGDGLKHLPLADRATLGNMSPEFGSTVGIFPIDGETIRYLELSGRSEEQCKLVEEYARAQGMWREDGEKPADYTDVLELDMGTVVPSIAGPKRPQDRIELTDAQKSFNKHLQPMITEREKKTNGEASFEGEGGSTAVGSQGNQEAPGTAAVEMDGQSFNLNDGAVVIAAITSCTNTSNPAVMIGAGLLARNAAAKGLTVKPWVKTSLAPGSKVVTDYLVAADLLDDLETLGFNVVGYGCTTCIGNSGPLRPEISKAIQEHQLVATSVLSGNRNFEGRIHPDVKMNFLASPPLVVAYALAGSMNVDLQNDALGQDKDGNDVFLKDIWPQPTEIQDMIAKNINSKMFNKSYSDVFKGDPNWIAIDTPEGDIYTWPDSTYVKNPPYFEGMTKDVAGVSDISGARLLALLGDSVTTDHISPAGSIKPDSPAGRYLQEHGVDPKDFNSYGSRRGNHEVMMRGTFANIRLRNLLAPGTEGGVTTHIPSGEQMDIFDAAMKYKDEGTPLVVIAGEEYGTGSSRDWAAKGTLLLGVRAVIAKSYERIHRSNLIGMGVVPLQFKDGDGPDKLGLTGKETFDISGLDNGNAKEVTVKATSDDGKTTEFKVDVRLDTPKEVEYVQHGGILHYVLRQLAA